MTDPEVIMERMMRDKHIVVLIQDQHSMSMLVNIIDNQVTMVVGNQSYKFSNSREVMNWIGELEYPVDVSATKVLGKDILIFKITDPIVLVNDVFPVHLLHEYVL